jgi:hypothetical protein
VLELYPDLGRAFEKRILASPVETLGIRKRTRRGHWLWFLDELRKRGLEVRGEWPFNTESRGYHAVCRHIDSVLAGQPVRGAKVLGGPDRARKLKSGDGVDRPVTEPFQRVEMDAHKLDARFCVSLPHPAGSPLERIIHRLWVIVIVEVVSRAVLGYHLSLWREVSHEDVLRTLKRALGPWSRRPLSFDPDQVAYLEKAGFPSGLGPDWVGACWGETSVDGALAETCRPVEAALRDVVGSTLVCPGQGFSSRRSLDDRPFVEAFFKRLASGGFQRLTNTTGGSPTGRRGRSPENIAVLGRFQVEYAE